MLRHRAQLGIALVLGLLALAGCNFGRESGEEPRRPTLGPPIAWATARTLTATPEPSATPVVTDTATPTETAVPVASSTPLPPPTLTLAQAVTQVPPTAMPTWTSAPVVIVVPTAAPTLTAVPAQIFTPTNAPTLTSAPPEMLTPRIVPTQSATPVMVFTQPPTFTPAIYFTQTPLPTALPSAQVCATCDNLRLRGAPGTAGTVITMLAAYTPLTIIGRTADNAWLQVVLADGSTGWVAAQYVDVGVDLNLVSVTGTAQNAPTAVAAAVPGGVGVVSGVSSHARQVFLDGRARGNLAHAFTRVGDSISASPYFLTQIGAGNYRLGDYGYLGGAISFFSGPNGRGANPFAAASMAARNGWSTESVLNPANADSGICRAGETPLECEYRVVRPAVALIMFGTNDSGGMPTATFQANLQHIVQISINMGVIPVLSTIPPKHYNPATDGRVAEFNQVIIATARAYDIPLWDYYSAMAVLPGEGLAADGVHPSVPPSGVSTIFDAEHLRFGYTVRNLTALQVLYTLWQQVLYDGDQAPAATAPPAVVQPPGGIDDAACQGAPPPRLVVGGQGRVTPGLPNKVRSQPGTSAPQIGSIPGEGVFAVIGGPQCADGYLWWQVNYQGVIGWTANGSGAEYWVEPYP